MKTVICFCEINYTNLFLEISALQIFFIIISQRSAKYCVHGDNGLVVVYYSWLL